MTQLVSILIPTYNCEKWIGACLESALAQTWPRKEIIIVDDGSIDSTFRIAKSYASSIVHVRNQKNRGASAARNRALSLAQGDYIQYLDADDILSPDKICIQLKDAEPGHISRTLLSGAFGNFYVLPERAKYEPTALWEDLAPNEWLYRKIDQNLWMAIETWLVSRRLTEMAGNWDEGIFRDNDGEYFTRVLSCCKKVRFVPNSISYCRRWTNGISQNFTLNDKKLESLQISLRLYIERMLKMENSLRTRTAGIKLLNRWAIYFYPERKDVLNNLELLAKSLGGELEAPKIRKKYRWLNWFFGWRIAKKVQNTFPFYRSLFIKRLEHLLLK